MVQAIRDLAEAARSGGTVQSTCRVCGNVALWSPSDLDRYWTRKGWDRSWRGFAKHLKCQCGERNPVIAWLVGPPPHDDDPSPPRPRFVRSGKVDNVVPMRRRKIG